MNFDPTSSYIRLRQMQEEDLPIILEIEITSYPVPWTWQIFQDCLKVGYVARVLEVNNRIVGYGLMSVGAGEANILNICVHPLYQHQGYGRRILKHLLALARQDQVKTVFLEVRVSNQVAIHIYLKTGFKPVGRRKNYYPGESHEREDGLVLAKEINLTMD